MTPLLVGAIPVLLIIIGMILNNLNIRFTQPPSSPEQDPAKRLAEERKNFREFFNEQRTRALKRQQRFGQYAWLLLIVTIGSFIWVYMDTVQRASVSNRIAMLQTLATEEGKQTVLSVTQLDGDNVKYLIKPDKTVDAAAVNATKEKVPSYAVLDMGTALSEGDGSLPRGITLKISK